MKIPLLLAAFFIFTSVSFSQSKEDKLYELYVLKARVYYRDYNTDSIAPMMESFQKAINIKPNRPEAFWRRGWIKEQFKDYRGAIKDYTTSVEKDPSFIDGYYSRSLLKGKLQDWRGVLSDTFKVKELFEEKNIKEHGLLKYEYLIYNIGSCKQNLGDNEEACIYYSKAGELGYYEAYKAIEKFCN